MKTRPIQIIRLTGKYCQVFGYLALLAKYQGDKTLGELIKTKGA